MSEIRATEPTDARQADLGFGEGGVPWYLTLYYLAFLGFFVWYVLEFQLTDYLDKHGEPTPPAAEAPK